MGRIQVTGRRATDICDAIERAIRDGQIRPGEQLPTVRALADDLDVSPTTIAASYRQLRQRGIISTHGRGGTRVHERPPLDVTVEDRLPDDVVDLRHLRAPSSVLPERPSLDTATLSRPGDPEFDDPDGDDPALLDLFAKDLVADSVDATHMAVAPNGAAALSTLLAANLRPGDRIAVEDPLEPLVRDLMVTDGYQLQPITLDQRGIVPDRLADGLSTSVQAVFLSPRAQDPTAAAFDEERRFDVLDVLDKHPGLLVIERDAHGPVSGVNYRTVSSGRQRWAVVRSWGMALGSDLDTTVTAGDITTIARVRGRQRLAGLGAPRLLQSLTSALLADEDTHRTVLIGARTYGARRITALAELQNRGITAQGLSGNHIWVPVDREDVVVESLRARGWAVAPGSRFRIASEPGIRVAVANLTTDLARRFADDLLEVLAA